ncbi:ROK family transcriptional regulator [Variovorax sp. PCZ-1]|uniref:ROK family transcriptional regulator n=1 Tax=Variovorax sp. PCZ-1 TaxID=2835533 RepID=UPI001BD005E6|nr:ROK family transcriptional regulator [Variovorax sp. PCZ-1]MBS7806102.1 ROK family transcriptional regulator [Variovorax sp. PCZ-1]
MQDFDVSTHANENASDEGLHFKPRGSNQLGMRQYNERVVLQAIRLHGSCPKAELARLTHLSTQTVSLIIDRLIGDGLVVKQEAVRGKVGQPSVPIALNPDGAFSIGIKVGRRSVDTLLLDFTGQVRERDSLSYDFPDPPQLLAHLKKQLLTMPQRLGAELSERIAGIGVAAPLSIGGWPNVLGVDPDRAAAWGAFDLGTELSKLTPIPVQFIKDTAAACVAELVAGRGRNTKSFVYVFIDTFIGGGLVLDNQWRSGLTGNAGAVGSMACSVAQEHAASPPQALSIASLHQLEARLIAAGLEGDACYSDQALERDYLPHTQAWLAQAVPALGLIVHNAACLLDLEAVIVDGNLGRGLLHKLQAQLREHLTYFSWEGVNTPALLSGTIGADARALGGGLLPLYSSFAPDPEVFLKLDR